MRKLSLAAIFLCVAGTSAATGAPLTAAGELRLTVDPERVLHTIDPLVYGQLIEHIDHATNGGLWGDIVWQATESVSYRGLAAPTKVI